MRIYKDLEMVEQLGSGIPRILDHYGEDSFYFSENFLRLVFPAIEQVTPQVTPQVGKLLKVMENIEYTSTELMEILNIKQRPTFHYNYLQPALNQEFIEMTIPDKPRSSKQHYRLTQKGNKVKKQ